MIVQADGVDTPSEILVCPLSTTYVDAEFYRPVLEPSERNGLKKTSYVMADKVGPVPRIRIAEVIGRLSDADISRLDVALTFILDLAA